MHICMFVECQREGECDTTKQWCSYLKIRELESQLAMHEMDFDRRLGEWKRSTGCASPKEAGKRLANRGGDDYRYSTYGELRKAFPDVTDLIKGHEWDNKKSSDQIQWLCEKLLEAGRVLADLREALEKTPCRCTSYPWFRCERCAALPHSQSNQ